LGRTEGKQKESTKSEGFGFKLICSSKEELPGRHFQREGGEKESQKNDGSREITTKTGK